MGLHHSAYRALERLVRCKGRGSRNYRRIIRCNEARLRLCKRRRRKEHASIVDGLVHSGLKYNIPPEAILSLADAVLDAYFQQLKEQTTCKRSLCWEVRALRAEKQRVYDAIDDSS